MNETNVKGRTLSRCREWERQRRNKFNETISKLCETVKAVCRATDPSYKDPNNAQYPKVEIIQRAILCLSNCEKQAAQLKAEILALQVKLDNKLNKRDVSIQVSVGPVVVQNQNLQGGKNAKLFLLKKSKRNALKEKQNEASNKVGRGLNLPKLLPKPPSHERKGGEGALVVVGARPLLLPPAPPTLLLLPPALPRGAGVVARSRGAVTRTTTVNVLPIAAHCATRTHARRTSKRGGARVVGKAKRNRPSAASDSNAGAAANKENDANTSVPPLSPPPSERDGKRDAKPSNEACERTRTSEADLKGSGSIVPSSLGETSTAVAAPVDTIRNVTATDSLAGPASSTVDSDAHKVSFSAQKEKDKLETALDAEGGAARLELAEELLAASPTAAFLLSFPVVSVAPLTQTPAYFHKTDTAKTKTKVNSTAIHTEKQNKFIDDMLAASKPSEMKPTASSDNPFLYGAGGGEDLFYKSDPFAAKCDPFAAKNDPFAAKSDPFIGKSDTFASKSDPFTAKSDPFAAKSDPFAAKNDPFSAKGDTFVGKNAMYGSGCATVANHDFNSLGLYPCAVDKYGSKSKSDFGNVDDSLMKLDSSRLTYDIDLGWSHKGFDFAPCSSAAPAPTPAYSSAYHPPAHPFSADFHVPLPATASVAATAPNKPPATIAAFPDPIPSFYSQPTNFWADDAPYYNNTNAVKIASSKPPGYLPFDGGSTRAQVAPSRPKPPAKQIGSLGENNAKPVNIFDGLNAPEKHAKKSPSKMHINWMTSDTRTTQSDTSYFPIGWEAWGARGGGSAEVSIEPPPLNLPTLVGDLALGPTDRKRDAPPLFSVSHLVTPAPPRAPPPRIDNDFASVFSSSTDVKTQLAPDHSTRFHLPKTKTNKPDKISKSQKSYSTEALLRGGSCDQRGRDETVKFGAHLQKYNEFNASETQMARFPGALDYAEPPGPLYNTGGAGGANSFYPNFMSGNYPAFSGDYVDYGQPQPDCGAAPRQHGPPRGTRRDYRHRAECGRREGRRAGRRVRPPGETEEWAEGWRLDGGDARPPAHFPATSRTNFNLSTIFPEITTKVQS